ncbi:MAG TPA: PadR family transcriptional regulator [Anaerolineae bacterium]|jgi:DNA-binding PadR family transcriptional regulator|nr:PadR family transcriptional regulator [Anaerolineae bacterium]
MMTNAELAVLGLIVERPRHGYEIEGVIQERGMREWTEVGFSSIYYLLKKLERGGLIKGRLGKKTGRGPARKVYEITAEGRQTWTKAVREALSMPEPWRTPFLLGLANAAGLPAGEVLESLRAYHDGLADRQEHVRGQAEEQRPLPDHVEALFDYSLAMIGAEWEWVAAYIKQLEAKRDKD